VKLVIHADDTCISMYQYVSLWKWPLSKLHWCCICKVEEVV